MLVNIALLPSLVFLCGLLASSQPEDVPQAGGALAVVVNSANKTTNLSQRELKQILKGESTFWDEPNVRIQLVLPNRKSPARSILERKVYRKRINLHFKKKSYRQRGGKPVYARRDSALQQVRNQPGAIAVVASSALAKDPNLRVLTIDNKNPGDVGYFLNSSVIKP